MKWLSVYMIGYILVLAGILLALWKTGVMASIGPFWIGVGLIVAIGIGIMISVANSGEKKTVEIDKT